MNQQKLFGDREMMEDVLSSQKFVTEGYNTFANECASPSRHERAYEHPQ